jgi:DNA-binding SARP family transcriptional activator/tetratricopeptide (TPR) repeat protein
MAWFSSTRSALEAAIDIQRVLSDIDAGGTPLSRKLRVGLHVGEAEHHHGDLFGEAVNAAARITAQAAGGEILVSQAVKDVAGTMPGVELLDRGAVALKGFPEPWRVFCAEWNAGPPPSPRVRLLGPIDVVNGDGTAVPASGPKERTVLALLALAPGSAVSTDALVDALWGDSPPASAERTLQSHVSRLRRKLEDVDGIDLERIGDTYRLACGPEGTDVLAVEARLSEARQALDSGENNVALAVLREAEAAWRGPVLSGVVSDRVTLADAVRLDELRLTVLELRVDADLGAGHDDTLVPELEALTRRYPLRERLWRARMLALYRRGRPAEALRAFQEVRSLIGDELGLEPSEELRSLEQAIVREDPSLRRAEFGEPPSTPPSDRLVPIPAPLARPAAVVGRDQELAELRAMLADTSPDTAQVAVLEGDAGVGKTALASAFAREAREAGTTVLYGRCEEGLGYAYQPFAEALGPLLSSLPDEALTGLTRHAPELTRLRPALAASFPDLVSAVAVGAETERWAMFSAVVSVLAIASRDRPVVLVLDDLHWAAPDTVQLVRHLARHPGGQRLLVVATFRGHDVDDQHAVADLIADLYRDLPGRRLQLEGLDVTAVAELVGRALGHALDESVVRVAEELWAETSGNAFFVGEVLRHVIETGDISRAGSGDLVLARDPASTEIPAGVRELLGRRLANLSADCRPVLASAAVIGSRFRLPLLETVTHHEHGINALDAVEEAVAAGLVVEHGTAFAFAHALVHQTVLADLGPARRARLHRRVGDALEDSGRDDPDALAHHFCRAAHGDSDLAPKAGRYALSAARQSIDRVSPRQAAGQAQEGLDALALATDPDPALRVDLLTEWCHANGFIVWGKEEREHFYRAVAAAEQAALELGDPIRRARLAVVRTGAPVVGSEDHEQQIRDDAVRGTTEGVAVVDRERLLAAVEDLGTRDLVLRARLLARLAAVHKAQGDHEVARQHTDEARRCADESGDQLAVADSAAAEMLLLDTNPDRDRALEIANILDKQPSTLEGWFANAALVRRVVAWERGQLTEADSAQKVLQVEAERTGLALRLFDVVSYRMLNHMARGEWAAADAEMGEILAVTSHPNALAVWAANQMALHRDTGRWQEFLPAVEATAEADPDSAAFGAALALANAELGNDTVARPVLEEFTRAEFATVRHDPTQSVTLCLLAETAVRLDDRGAMEALYPLLARYAGLVPSVGGTVSLGSVDRFLGALADGLGRRDDAEAHFRVALELEEGLGATAYLVRTRCTYARMLTRRGRTGDHDTARELLDAVLEDTERLGMPAVHDEAQAVRVALRS